MMSVFLLFSLFSVGFSQQLISLSSLKGEKQKNDLLFPAPYCIYVSATPESDDTLDRIYIVTDDGRNHSLLDLVSDMTPLSGEIDRFVVQKSSYLTTGYTAKHMKNLKGVMFISSPKQVADNGFQVFDINYAKSVQSIGNGPPNRTIVFLNTDVKAKPHNSAVISNWEQDSDAYSSVLIYPGIPSDSIEPENTYIFSNPMYTDKFVEKFEHVEMFSLTMVAFYLKTYKKPWSQSPNTGVNFRIEPGYYTVDKTSTRFATTTGFYMKPLSKNESLVTINTVRDNRYSGGSTGANILGYLSPGAKVTVAESGGAYNDQFSTAPNDTIVSWSTPNNGNKLSFASTPRSTGQFYVQYYVDQGQLKQLSDRDQKPLQNQEVKH